MPLIKQKSYFIMLKKKTLTIALIGFLSMVAGHVNAQMNSSLQGMQVECLGVELDGSQTVRVLGAGRNRADAIEQAKKNAVNAVLFTGIRGGKAGCDMRPLVPEVNAREKYEEYFNIFFMDKGEYMKYVSMEDKRRGSSVKSKTKNEKMYRITVRVLRNELKSRLRADGILHDL